MARVKRVEKSRKAHTCTTYLAPSHEIPKGDPYLYAAPGFRGREIYRCVQHPFQPSELTVSMAGEPMRAQEEAHRSIDAAESAEDIDNAVAEFVSALEEYVGVRQEALDAWENGNSTLEELLEYAQGAQDAVEGQWNEQQEYDGEFNEDGTPVDEDEYSQWLEDLKSEASDLIDQAEL